MCPKGCVGSSPTWRTKWDVREPATTSCCAGSCGSLFLFSSRTLGRRGRLSVDAERQILGLYDGGVAAQKIASDVGVSVGVIYRVLKRHGRKPDRQGGTWNQIVVDVYNAGESRSEITRVSGVAEGSQYWHLKRAGARPNRRPSR